MRLSGFVIAAVLFVSATLLGQHTSGAGGSSSGGSSSGASHSSYSGGSSSSASSHSSSSSASHIASTGAAASRLSPSAKLPSTKENAAPEKKGFFSSLRHPFRKPVQRAEFRRPVRCLKEPCAVCPPGESRNGNGACVVANNGCAAGQSWNGFACGTQYWFNDCRALADQLAAERQQIRGRNDPGQSLRHRRLQEQYEDCLMRSRLPFGAYAFNDARLLDTPLDTP